MRTLQKILLFSTIILLSQCASYNNYPKSTEDNTLNNQTDSQRKIIYNAYLTIAVEYPDSIGNTLNAIAKKYEGYVQEAGTFKAVLRVKSQLLDQAVLEVTTIGKLKEKRLSARDITEEYQDFEIRLDNALKARERYLALLKEAENVDAALKVEKELERLNGVIELLKGKMNLIDNQSQFATININLEERKKSGLLGYIGLGLYHSVKWLFVRN